MKMLEATIYEKSDGKNDRWPDGCVRVALASKPSGFTHLSAGECITIAQELMTLAMEMRDDERR